MQPTPELRCQAIAVTTIVCSRKEGSKTHVTQARQIAAMKSQPLTEVYSECGCLKALQLISRKLRLQYSMSFLTKPVEANVLLNTIQTLIIQRQRSATAKYTSHGATCKGSDKPSKVFAFLKTASQLAPRHLLLSASQNMSSDSNLETHAPLWAANRYTTSGAVIFNNYLQQ